MTGVEQGRCLVADCGWAGPTEFHIAAEHRMVWHVFVAHPDVWRAVVGSGRVPRCARPEGAVS